MPSASSSSSSSVQRAMAREHHQPITMLEKRQARELLFSTPTKNSGSHHINTTSKCRPASVHTEFMETDWEIEDDEEEDREQEDDDEVSDFDDDEPISAGSSPRASLDSSGQPSMTTLSSYDEVHTPASTRIPPPVFTLDLDAKPVEGPRGPHLFRSSISTAHSSEFENALSLSPVLPKDPHVQDHQLPLTMSFTPLPSTTRKKRYSGPFRFTDQKLDTAQLAHWHPEMIAQWMLNAGIELSVAERFVENDINGAILVTLKFEDLKELGITSFGVRTRVWEEMASMRRIRPATPDPETPIEDEPDRAVRRELRREKPKPRPTRHKVHPKINDVISPLESVSIVGIEQLVPKPHHCSKGENCSKWRKNQRIMEQFKREHPFVDMTAGRIIMVAGDPGNPATAEALKTGSDVFRPVSDAVPSVVASSDVMGPDNVPMMQHYLGASTLRGLQARDPKETVRQFLTFQRQHEAVSSEVPPTPPFEMSPREAQHANVRPSRQNQTSQQRLQALPKLSIPTQMPVGPRRQPASAQPAPSRYRDDASAVEDDGCHTVTVHAEEHAANAEEPTATPTGPIYRFGTPFSDMDVPVTTVPLGPVARDTSQSVPPDMNYRPQLLRSASRATSRRPSFPVMPALDENAIVSPTHCNPSRVSRSLGHRAGAAVASAVGPVQRPLQAPPRCQYPWTQSTRPTMEKAIAPMPGSSAELTANATTTAAGGVPLSHNHHHGIPHQHSHLPPSINKALPKPPGSSSSSSISSSGSKGPPISYAGLMRKRKTKMLRHEWAEHYFQLRGTRLTMHPRDGDSGESQQYNNKRTLEYIDVDDYAIACSSAASGSKLNAAFRAMHIRRGSDEAARRGDVAAFSFQLIPQDARGGVRLRRRESGVPAAATAGVTASAAEGRGRGRVENAPVPEGTPNGTGKTHHFAVGGRDERIDWMRELMLAKAKKQKGEGFEVSVNGNMI